MLKNYGIILASGTGARFNNELPKQFVKIGDKTVLEHTLNVFENSKYIDFIILVIHPDYKEKAEEIISKNNYKKITRILNGGKTRKESSSIGIFSIDTEEANVFIHDCARPFLSEKILKDCNDALQQYKAVGVAIKTTDTILEVNNNIIKKIPDRKNLMCAQTPQCFRLSLIKKAHEISKNDENFTDDCGLVIKYNLEDIYIVEGESKNIKITYPSDIFLAEKIYNS